MALDALFEDSFIQREPDKEDVKYDKMREAVANMGDEEINIWLNNRFPVRDDKNFLDYEKRVKALKDDCRKQLKKGPYEVSVN